MRIYLFILDGKPAARTQLDLAQAAVEDNLRDRRDVSDVWWDSENPHTPRVYLYGASHSDYLANEAAGVDSMDADISWEQQDQLIWPVEISQNPLSRRLKSDLPGTVLTLSVATPQDRTEMTRVVPQDVWKESVLDPRTLVAMFAAEAAVAVGDKLIKKEKS